MQLDIWFLRKEGLLSERAFNICERTGLNNVNDIVKFYQAKKTFKFIRNCGDLTENELTNFAIKNLKTNVLSNDINKYTLPVYNKIDSNIDKFNIFHQKEPNNTFSHPFSSRFKKPNKFLHLDVFKKIITSFCNSYLISNYENLINEYIFKLTLDYSKQNKNEENYDVKVYLTTLCENIISIDNEGFLKTKIIEYLKQSHPKLELLFLRILPHFNNLSERCKSAIKNRNLFGREKIIDLIICSFSKNNISKWSKVGESSVSELTNFLNNCRCLSRETYMLKADDIFNKNLELIYNGLILDDYDLNSIKNKNLNFINFICKNKKYFFDELEIDFLEEIPKEILSKKWNLSRERIRQISVKSSEEINSKLNRLFLDFNQFCYDDLLLNFSENIHDLAKIENRYSFRLNQKILFSLLKIVHNNIHFFDFNNSFLYKNLTSPNNKYHVSLQVSNIFNIEDICFFSFESFKINEFKKEIILVFNELLKRNNEIYYFNIDNSKLFFQVLNNCLNRTYGFEFLENSELLIFKQTNVTFLYLTLEKFGKPVHLDEIYESILDDDRFTKKPKSKDSIRSLAITNDLFFTIGKTSTYGLKIWNEDNTYATKSIKEECRDILFKVSQPLHVNKIFKFLSERRENLKIRSVSTILKMENKIFQSDHGFYSLVKNGKFHDRVLHHRVAFHLFNNVIKFYHPLKDNISNPTMFEQLAQLEMPNFQLDFFKEQYLNMDFLNKKLTKEEEFIRDKYISGESVLALQEFKSYFKLKNPKASSNDIYNSFKRLIE